MRDKSRLPLLLSAIRAPLTAVGAKELRLRLDDRTQIFRRKATYRIAPALVSTGFHDRAAHAVARGVHNLVVIDVDNKTRLFLLNVLRHRPDTLWRHWPAFAPSSLDVVLVIVCVKTLTQFLNIGLLALVRKERRSLLRRGRRTGQGSSAHRDVRKELGDLERITALLQELLIARREVGLLRLLLKRACSQKRLSPSKARLLRPRAKCAKLLPCGQRTL